MLATTKNWPDIKKYYQGTFVKLAELGEVPLFVDKVTSTAIFFVNKDNEKVELQLCDEGYDLNYCIPKKTVFQLGDLAHIIERVPARMWRKGLTSENSCISTINETGEFFAIPWGMDAVNAFVNKQQYHTLWEHHNYPSIALNRRFYALRSGLIGVDGTIVGKVDLKKNKLYYRKPFHKEFTTLFGKETFELVGVGV